MNWVQGDATDSKVVDSLLKDADAAVHAIGTLLISAIKYHKLLSDVMVTNNLDS